MRNPGIAERPAAAGIGAPGCAPLAWRPIEVGCMSGPGQGRRIVPDIWVAHPDPPAGRRYRCRARNIRWRDPETAGWWRLPTLDWIQNRSTLVAPEALSVRWGWVRYTEFHWVRLALRVSAWGGTVRWEWSARGRSSRPGPSRPSAAPRLWWLRFSNGAVFRKTLKN